ncbi:O-methyltransferase involved in polyketide biosynthesis [Actinopolyspora biskrensis]|uniref:O-methyltransferase involved in polyketide biosynthesis n=1 Tax=Actinopolyspora biskrensis TaxID=1470178 RepID=A0A852YY19_9ACTN|nr:class I SAM-dependent methyltransferase [Actinopolyspora biskrensis]NYH77865.1 O-methyltransferase involved in polyketide biosynthesis [Actinopolyspora biskrensis]
MRFSRPRPRPDSISPTAHYTGYVWARNGLGGGELATTRGGWYYRALQPAMVLSRAFGGPVPEDFLLARHGVIDHLLSAAIEAGHVDGVLELASGMSPRGHEFARRHGSAISYVETDLPDMAARKRDALDKLGSLGPNHRVEALDVLRGHGGDDLLALADEFTSGKGLAVISEGLLNYLPTEELRTLWARVLAVLRRFGAGLYLSDLHVAEDNRGPVDALGATLLGRFVGTGLHFHFTIPEEVRKALTSTGFDPVELYLPSEFADLVLDANRPSADRVRVISAGAART